MLERKRRERTEKRKGIERKRTEREQRKERNRPFYYSSFIICFPFSRYISLSLFIVGKKGRHDFMVGFSRGMVECQTSWLGSLHPRTKTDWGKMPFRSNHFNKSKQEKPALITDEKNRIK